LYLPSNSTALGRRHREGLTGSKEFRREMRIKDDVRRRCCCDEGKG
jgi:hypothetical protein